MSKDQKPKVSQEIAERDMNSWLDYKKIDQQKRDGMKDTISSMVDAMCSGALVFNPENHTLSHELKFPLEAEVVTSKLVYKPRIQIKRIHQEMSGVKSGDADGRLAAYVAALTDIPKALVKNLDTEDYSLAQAIATFFL